MLGWQKNLFLLRIEASLSRIYEVSINSANPPIIQCEQALVDGQQHRQQAQTNQKSRRKDPGNFQLNRQRGKVRRRKN